MQPKTKLEATFIDGKKGKLFALHRPPHSTSRGSECLVLAPSFAEEMNRCRYMCTMLSQSINTHGYGYLSVDPYGTGDSAGDFVEGDWQTWCDDLLTACQFARELGYLRVSLLGIRMGALLAMDIAEHVQLLHRLLLWQPVISGKTALNQFLRIRIAASLERDEEGGTVAQFEKNIDAGDPIEIAGYYVSPELYRGIQATHLENHLHFNQVPITWFNTLASEDRKIPRAELGFIEKWRQAGADLEQVTVVGPPFWASHERSLAPDLVDATVRFMNGKA